MTSSEEALEEKLEPIPTSVRVVCISDTHGHHAKLHVPDGDILIHAGDFTSFGKMDHITSFNTWLGTLPHPHKIVVSGNHEIPVQLELKHGGMNLKEAISNANFLANETLTCQGLRIHGIGWQGDNGHRVWNVPRDLDLLVTHNPSSGIGTLDGGEGCDNLRRTVMMAKPRAHVFGHVHSGYGCSTLGDTLCVNAASVNWEYKPSNPPVVLDFEFSGEEEGMRVRTVNMDQVRRSSVDNQMIPQRRLSLVT